MVKKRVVNKKKENFLISNLRESLDYIRESSMFIWIVVGIFFFFTLLAFFVPTPDEISKKILESISELLIETSSMGHFELIGYIFFNNLKVSFFGLFLGVFLGAFPIMASLANGYLLGFVGVRAVSVEGIFVLWKLLPHGVFELPAIFISLGLGLKFGTFIFKKRKLETFKDYFFNSVRVFFFVIFPLLVVAAIIEGTLIFYLR